MSTPAAHLRMVLARESVLVAPGVYDPFTACLAAEAGFSAVYLSGQAFHGPYLGIPNVGLATLTETNRVVARVAAAVDIPVIVAAETGFGGPLEVRRAVIELEAVGAAAIEIGDQVRGWPTFGSVKADLLSVEEMQLKVAAAKEAQRDPDFVFIGRTDSAGRSVEEAVARCNAYVEAGADMAMPMMSAFLSYTGAQTERDARNDVLRRWVGEIGAPVVTHSPFGLDLTPAEAEACGISLYVVPQACLGYSAAASWGALNALRAGTLEQFAQERPPHPLTGDHSALVD